MNMPELKVETVFVVGAGFSHHAGLPLTSNFTAAILEAREFGSGPSRILVEFLSMFIRDAFDHHAKSGAKHWPDLEDIFTCVDLSANSGHNLGSAYSPADLRTVRRAMLSRIIRMLDQKYRAGRKKKGLEWKKLDDFFFGIAPRSIGFISMNWDTLIERKLALTQDKFLLDYCCEATPARIPDPADPDDYSKRAYLKEAAKREVIELIPPPKAEKSIPVVKIHGSANWLYCDNCRQLFWFHPDQSTRIANQIIRKDDLRRIKGFLRKKDDRVTKTIENLLLQRSMKCPCTGKVELGTRIATFSYRKALDFPMFQKSWLAAEELLRSASRWVFIGYSLPAADYEFKYLLKRTQLSRAEQPEFIVVSGGGNADVHRTYDNYQKFFGRSLKKTDFFGDGLSIDAIKAICR